MLVCLLVHMWLCVYAFLFACSHSRLDALMSLCVLLVMCPTACLYACIPACPHVSNAVGQDAVRTARRGAVGRSEARCGSPSSILKIGRRTGEGIFPPNSMPLHLSTPPPRAIYQIRSSFFKK